MSERFIDADPDGRGSEDDTLPRLFTTDELGARYGLPDAPVSPAPRGPARRPPGSPETGPGPGATDPFTAPGAGLGPLGEFAAPGLGAPPGPAPRGSRAPRWRPSPRPVPRHARGARRPGGIYYTAGFRTGSAPGDPTVPAAIPGGRGGHASTGQGERGSGGHGVAVAEPGWRPYITGSPTDTFDPAVPRRPSTSGGHPPVGRTRVAWEARYTHALLAADLLAALVGGGIAFDARFHAVTPYNRPYALFTGLLPLVFVASLLLNRAYERRFLFVGTEEYQRVMRSGLALTAMAAIVSYAFNAEFARGYVIVALPLATLVCLGIRFGLRHHLHRRRDRGECLRRVIVVGHEHAVVAIARQLGRELYHGLGVVGCCLPPHHSGEVGLPVYGTFDDVAVAVRDAEADTVLVLSCPELDGQKLRRLAWRLERGDIDLIVASSLIDVAGARTTIRPVDGLPMLHVEHPRLSGASRVVKTVFDRVCAGIGLVLFAPVLFAICVAVRRDSPGPVLFRQVRVGKGGREFVIFKFRTMTADAERRRDELAGRNDGDGVLFKMRDDPRITRVGRLLRRFSLDELPQLVNVLRGDMSLVGPRPPLPREVAAYPVDMRRRLAVSPGLTGLWQVSGRSDLSWEEAVRLDLRYVENWSFSLDCVILLRTLSAVCRSSGAY